MAVNRFDTPAQYNPIDTYVPLPLQQLMGAVEYKQKQGEVAEDALLKLGETQLGETLKQIDRPGFGRTDVGDISKANLASSKMQEFNARVSDLSSRGIDPADPMYRREIKKLGSEMRQFFSAEGVGGEAMQRAEEYKQLEAALAKAEIGDQPWLANPIRKELDRFIKEGGPINLGVSAIKDVDMGLLSDRLVSGLSADVKDITTAQVGPNGEIVYTSTGRKEITEDRIRNTAYGLINNSDAANKLNAIEEHYRDLARETGATAEEAAKIGLAQREKHYKQIEDSLVAKYKLLATQDGVQITGSGKSTENPLSRPTTTNVSIDNTKTYDPYNINPKSQIQGKDGTNYFESGMFDLMNQEGNSEFDNWYLDKKDQYKNRAEAFEYWKTDQERIEKIRKINQLTKFAKDYGIDDVYVVSGQWDLLEDVYKSVMEDIKTTGGVHIGVPEKYASDIMPYIGRNLSDLTVNINGDSLTSLGNPKGKQTLADKTGWSFMELKNALAGDGKIKDSKGNIVASVDVKGSATNSTTPGSIRLEVTDKTTGKERKQQIRYLDVIPSNEFKNSMSNIHNLAIAAAKGIKTEPIQIGEYDDKTPVTIQVIPSIQMQGKKYVPKIIITNKSGTKELKGAAAKAYLNEVYNSTYLQYGHSGYAGSGYLNFDKTTGF